MCQSKDCEIKVGDARESVYCVNHTRQKYFNAMYHRIVMPGRRTVEKSLNEFLVCA